MMHRRELLLVGAGVVAAKATASAIACANDGPAPEGKKGTPKKEPRGSDAAKGKDEHAGHEGHEGHAAGGGDVEPASAENASFAAAANGCLVAGDACLAHCLRLLGSGDTSMADCSKNVNAMLAVCRAIGTLAQGNSKHLAAAAKLCHDTCSDCAAACKPHIGHHEECKACFEACNETIKVAKTFI